MTDKALSESMQNLEKSDGDIGVVVETELGNIHIDVKIGLAPVTAANFIKLVDEGVYADSWFYRSVVPGHPVTGSMELIQGGILPRYSPFEPIPHETTEQTGMRHTMGVVSMARRRPGTASSEFFICLCDMPMLDYNPIGAVGKFDGFGYASFGYVTKGLDIARLIQQQKTGDKAPNLGENFEELSPQIISNPILINGIKRAC